MLYDVLSNRRSRINKINKNEHGHKEIKEIKKEKKKKKQNMLFFKGHAKNKFPKKNDGIIYFYFKYASFFLKIFFFIQVFF